MVDYIDFKGIEIEKDMKLRLDKRKQRMECTCSKSVIMHEQHAEFASNKSKNSWKGLELLEIQMDPYKFMCKNCNIYLKTAKIVS